MINELKSIVKNSTEDEVKSLFFQTLLRINMLEETERYTEEQLVTDLKRTYSDFLQYKRKQTDVKNNKSYQAVHILFGDSPAGSFKRVLNEMELQDEEKVIAFSDLFSIGPIWQLHEQVGLKHRYEWIKDHLIFDDDYIDEYQYKFNQTTSMIEAIPENTPITIWIGENSHEQTALRYVLYLLREKNNDIFLMNTTEQYKKEVPHQIIEGYPLHTGEIASEKLRLIYENSRMAPPLSHEQRKEFEKEWLALASTIETLRIWQNSELKSVDEAYYDDYIIGKAKELLNGRKNNEFMKSARLIGEVIGYLDQYIGDAYIEYRVRHLIMNGTFEIKGVPKAMRFYSVRLK